MSSTVQATSSTSNFQLIINHALVDYAKITGIDLSKNPIAAMLEQSNSSEAILELLQERESSFKEYRDGDRRLISCLSPAVKVLHAFSGILGEAASTIPFSPGKAVFTSIDVLLAAASGVTSSYDALLELFECLGNFLKRLEIYITISPTSMMTDIIVQIMVEVLSVLALATKQIKQGRFKKFAKKLLKEGEVEAALQKLDRLTKDEAQMTVAQTLGVVHGLVANVKVVMEDGKASRNSIRQDLAALHETLNEMNKMKRDQLQWDVQHWLSPPDPSMNHNLLLKARHGGTAAWFFESDALAEWKATGSFLWVHGKPGAGKSTLLSAIIQDVEGMRAIGLATLAYYYFDFRDTNKQDCYGLLSSLILQLSAESDSCYNLLSKLYSDNTRGIRKPTISALKKCITDMLSLPGQTPIYIIVDALDECPNISGTPSAREEVLELIEELSDLKLPHVHLCVASRSEMDIRIVLEPLTSLKIPLHDESGQREDIIKYIKSVVRSDRSMRRWKEEDKQLVIDTLSDRADGMFRWVVCQVDRLRRTFPASIRIVLDDLPKTLDETYARILLGIDEEKREYAERLFRCLTVSIRPLRVEELAEILAIRFDKATLPTFNAAWRPENAEEAVMSACSSLITVVDREGNQVVQFAHFSVKEYLTSERLATAEERLSYYHILPEPAHIILAHAGLSILLQLDDKIDRNTIDHFPLAPYAARYWVDHAQFRNVSSHIQEVLELLFNPAKPHFAAWVWLYDIDRHWIEPMSKIHPTRPDAEPLYYAALSGFPGVVERLIAVNSRDVNSRGGSHTAPLNAALFKGHLKVASLLLENGADPNSRDHLGRAPLHRVSQAGQFVTAESLLEIARLLLNSGADVNATDKEGSTPLHAAAESGYSDIAELLLESGASLDALNRNYGTPLHVACGNGELDISRFLIDRGSDINSREERGYIPLHLASRYGHLDLVRLLLDRGSDVNARVTSGLTPLHLASLFGHLHVARFLIDRSADVNALQVTRCTPLHVTSASGHLDITKLLIDHGAIVGSRDDMQQTPLDLASRNGYLEIVRILVEHGAAVSAWDANAQTPFHSASYHGHLHVMKFFLDYGVDVDIRNGNDQTPLDVASMSGNLDVARFLIERGADIYARDKMGWNPLHTASKIGHLDIVRLLIDTGTPIDIQNGDLQTSLTLASGVGNVQVARFLIERGANINARDEDSSVPIHFASGSGHLDMVQLLLDRGADPNVQACGRLTPLHLVSLNGHLKIAELLLQRGARVDVFNDKLETSLDRAAGEGNVGICRLLIDRGANLHTTDSMGWTPLHSASYGGHLEVVQLLLLLGADVDRVNKANKTAAELASENAEAEVAMVIAEYKAGANIRNNIRSTTLDTAQHDTDELGKDEGKLLLFVAAEEGDIDVVNVLLEWGIDINGRNAANQTPLDRAARKGNLEVVRLLIERGAQVDSRDILGWTPLHYASRFEHLEVSRVLLDHGANVNARQLEHWTPMHYSACNGYFEVAKLLLERGADVHAVSYEGETPYQLSLRKGHPNIADLLREHGAGRESR